MNNDKKATTDDQLVARHKKAKEQKKRKLILTLVIVVIAVLVVVTIGVSVLRKQVSSLVSSSDVSEIQSAEVSVGSISTTVSGSGTLEAEEVESLTVPSTVEVVDYYVQVGDTVEEGDLIATVTTASVLTAMSDVQSQLDEIDEQLEEANGDSVDSVITASVAGRVKEINVEKGEDVAAAMYDGGALMRLSLDGYMAVDVTTDSLAVGDSVEVTLSDGTTVDGIVEKVVAGSATVLVTDNGTTYKDAVTVSDADGNQVGDGELYIHSQVLVTGYAGTVSSVSVSLDEKVSAGETLLKLTDTETSANYDTLLKERAEVEEELSTLIRIYKEGGVCATIAGTIDSLDSSDDSSDTSAYSMESTGTGSESTTVATISGNTGMEITISVDETDILSLEKGQEATVTIDSVGEDSFLGTVTEVNTTATSSSGVTFYSAVVRIDKTEAMLSGMSASVVVTIEGTDNALLVPIDAVHQTSASAYVYTEYNEESGEFSGMQEVTIGLSNSSYVEIKDGLSEGDTVYYTESEEDSGMGFGGMQMPGDMSGGNMQMPGGDSFSGGMQMPSGDSSSGGMPSGGNMPSGRGMPNN